MDPFEIRDTIFSELGKALLEKIEGNSKLGSIRVKLEFEDEIRAVQLSRPVLYEDLLRRVTKEFGANVFMKCLVSKENQVFHVLKDQNDLDNAIKLVDRACSNNPCILIRIIPCMCSGFTDVTPSSIIRIFSRDSGFETSPDFIKFEDPLKQDVDNRILRQFASLSTISPNDNIANNFLQKNCSQVQPSSRSLRTSSNSELGMKFISMNQLNTYPNIKSKSGVCLGEWKKGRLLGSGSFGKVFLCYDVESGREYAVKQVQVISRNSQHASREVKALREEINFLRQNIVHPHIVQYYGFHDDGIDLSILMEYMPGGSVESQIKQYGPLTERNTASYARQVLEGLEYLHKKSIVHRDIKGANILRDHDGNVKLSDFGASKRLQTISCMQTQTGTAYYMSPEVLDGNGYGRKTDIWSLGCTVVEMLTGHPPWHKLEGLAAIFKIVTSNESGYVLPENASMQARDFLDLCFERNPSRRPTSSQLLFHSFVKSLGFFDSDQG